MFLCRLTTTVLSLSLFTSLLAAAEPATKPLEMDYQREAVSLNGGWLALKDHADEQFQQPGAAEKVQGWQEVNIPGFISHERRAYVIEDHHVHGTTVDVVGRTKVRVDGEP